VIFAATALLALTTHPRALGDSSLRVIPNGDVCIGTDAPTAPLHISRAAGTSVGDNVGFQLENSSAGSNWVFTAVEGATDHFIINKIGSGMQEIRLNEGGDMLIPGTLTPGGPSCGGGCDHVLQPAMIWNRPPARAAGRRKGTQ